ncbi:hypothetical protein RQP54_09795 [Curvibacter sp. APW13]|uniref:hypothetical protein n=1 Tax=Curvibacter sp. APW13 TaxID=3077236 RepID=UPI0028DE7679|nr:hypothetical protein [Curvibacter sp. APW13]MDT8991156.1 hypothetical protein [Curvibacter sp. APW13]
MNADALSDLVLLLACVGSWWYAGVERPAWRGAMVLLGLAAACGVLRFSGLEWALGPHRFASLLAACVAFLLTLAALRWPQGQLARRSSAVGRFVVLVGGVGVALSQILTPLWSQVIPGVSALLVAWTMWQMRSVMGMVFGAVLLASFAVAALMPADALLAGLFNRTQAFHYLLALAVIGLGTVLARPSPSPVPA